MTVGSRVMVRVLLTRYVDATRAVGEEKLNILRAYSKGLANMSMKD